MGGELFVSENTLKTLVCGRRALSPWEAGNESVADLRLIYRRPFETCEVRDAIDRRPQVTRQPRPLEPSR
jgi:hypothetical protein